MTRAFCSDCRLIVDDMVEHMLTKHPEHAQTEHDIAITQVQCTKCGQIMRLEDGEEHIKTCHSNTSS